MKIVDRSAAERWPRLVRCGFWEPFTAICGTKWVLVSQNGEPNCSQFQDPSSSASIHGLVLATGRAVSFRFGLRMTVGDKDVWPTTPTTMGSHKAYERDNVA